MLPKKRGLKIEIMGILKYLYCFLCLLLFQTCKSDFDLYGGFNNVESLTLNASKNRNIEFEADGTLNAKIEVSLITNTGIDSSHGKISLTTSAGEFGTLATDKTKADIYVDENLKGFIYLKAPISAIKTIITASTLNNKLNKQIEIEYKTAFPDEISIGLVSTKLDIDKPNKITTTLLRKSGTTSQGIAVAYELLDENNKPVKDAIFTNITKSSATGIANADLYISDTTKRILKLKVKVNKTDGTFLENLIGNTVELKNY